MKKTAILTTAALLCSLNSFGHGGGSTSDDFSIPDTGSAMFHLPIKFGFDGNITFGYGSNMSGMDHDMSGGMDHDMGSGHDMGGDMGSGHDMGGDMGSGHDVGGDMGSGHDMGGDMGSGHDMGGDMGSGQDMGGDMDSGNDMDHDMGDDQDMGNDHQNHDSSNMDHGKIHWHVMPMISVGYDKVKRFISMEEVAQSDNEIKVSNGSKLKYVEAKKIEGGLGLMVMGHLMELAGNVHIMAGLLPYKGKYKFTERAINSKKDLEKFDAFKVPSSVDDLANWQEGDKLSFSTHGGVMMHGGIAFGQVLSITRDYMVQGKWRVALEYLGLDKVRVKVLNEDMTHVSTTVGNMVVAANAGKMKMEGQTESFIFSLNDEEAAKAYVHLLSGDLTKAQELSSESDAVIHESFGKTFMAGKMKSLRYHVPFTFSGAKTTMDMYSIGSSTDLDLNVKVDTIMNMYSKEKSTTGIWSKHKKQNEMFMSMVMKVAQEGSYKDVNYAGTWKRLYERDEVSASQLNAEMNRLVLKTGINKLNTLVLPKNKKLDYTRSEFEVSLTQGGTDALMKLAMDNKSRKTVLDNTYKKVNDVFRSNKTLAEKICKEEKLQTNCHKKMITRVSTNIVEVWDSLKAMKLAKDKKEYREFSRLYTRIGKFLMKNPLSFQGIIESIDSKFYKLELHVIGEKIPSQKIKF